MGTQISTPGHHRRHRGHRPGIDGDRSGLRRDRAPAGHAHPRRGADGAGRDDTDRRGGPGHRDVGRSWFWKSFRWFHAAAFTPVLMVLVLGVGVQMTSGVATGMTDDLQKAIGTAVPGVILICIGCFEPARPVQAAGVRRPGHQLRRRDARRAGRPGRPERSPRRQGQPQATPRPRRRRARTSTDAPRVRAPGESSTSSRFRRCSASRRVLGPGRDRRRQEVAAMGARPDQPDGCRPHQLRPRLQHRPAQRPAAQPQRQPAARRRQPRDQRRRRRRRQRRGGSGGTDAGGPSSFPSAPSMPTPVGDRPRCERAAGGGAAACLRVLRVEPARRALAEQRPRALCPPSP